MAKKNLADIRINLSTFNYIYIYWALLSMPINIAFIQFDGKGRILFVLTFLLFFANLFDRSFRKVAFEKPAIFWLIWCIYTVINSLVKGYHSEGLPHSFFLILYIVLPYVLMCIAAKEYTSNKIVFLTNMLVLFSIYALIGSIFIPIGYVQAQSGNGFEGTLGNSLGLTSLFIILFASLLYSNNKLKKGWLYLFVIATLVLLVIAATRKALGAGLILVVFLIIAYFKNNLKSFVSLIAIVILFWGAAIYVKNNTYIGQRFATAGEISEKYNPNHNFFLSFVGDRVIFYINGWKLFKEHPVTGIGINNYKSVTGSSLPIHSEYVVQLAECGLLGFTLFLLFYISLLRKIINKLKVCDEAKKEGIILLGAFSAIVFLDLTTWTYSLRWCFIAFGTIIGYIFESKYHTSSQGT